MKQSAVEFVFDAVYKDIPYSELLGLIAQAKIIEKEQKGYSEEEVISLLNKRDTHTISNLTTHGGNWLIVEEWFNHFKKK